MDSRGRGYSANSSRNLYSTSSRTGPSISSYRGSTRPFNHNQNHNRPYNRDPYPSRTNHHHPPNSRRQRSLSPRRSIPTAPKIKRSIDTPSLVRVFIGDYNETDFDTFDRGPRFERGLQNHERQVYVWKDTTLSELLLSLSSSYPFAFELSSSSSTLPKRYHFKLIYYDSSIENYKSNSIGTLTDKDLIKSFRSINDDRRQSTTGFGIRGIESKRLDQLNWVVGDFIVLNLIGQSSLANQDMRMTNHFGPPRSGISNPTTTTTSSSSSHVGSSLTMRGTAPSSGGGDGGNHWNRGRDRERGNGDLGEHRSIRGTANSITNWENDRDQGRNSSTTSSSTQRISTVTSGIGSRNSLTYNDNNRSREGFNLKGRGGNRNDHEGIGTGIGIRGNGFGGGGGGGNRGNGKWEPNRAPMDRHWGSSAIPKTSTDTVETVVTENAVELSDVRDGEDRQKRAQEERAKKDDLGDGLSPEPESQSKELQEEAQMMKTDEKEDTQMMKTDEKEEVNEDHHKEEEMKGIDE